MTLLRPGPAQPMRPLIILASFRCSLFQISAINILIELETLSVGNSHLQASKGSRRNPYFSFLTTFTLDGYPTFQLTGITILTQTSKLPLGNMVCLRNTTTTFPLNRCRQIMLFLLDSRNKPIRISIGPRTLKPLQVNRHISSALDLLAKSILQTCPMLLRISIQRNFELFTGSSILPERRMGDSLVHLRR